MTSTQKEEKWKKVVVVGQKKKTLKNMTSELRAESKKQTENDDDKRPNPARCVGQLNSRKQQSKSPKTKDEQLIHYDDEKIK